MNKLAFGISFYASSFYITLANVPANIISTFLVEGWFGRKKLLAISMILASVIAFAFAWSDSVNSLAYTLIIAMAFNSFGTLGWNALDLVSAELFPTVYRNTGMGLASSVGRLGALTDQLV